MEYAITFPDFVIINEVDFPHGTKSEPIPENISWITKDKISDALQHSDENKRLTTQNMELAVKLTFIKESLRVFMLEQRAKENYEVSDFIRELLD